MIIAQYSMIIYNINITIQSCIYLYTYINQIHIEINLILHYRVHIYIYIYIYIYCMQFVHLSEEHMSMSNPFILIEEAYLHFQVAITICVYGPLHSYPILIHRSISCFFDPLVVAKCISMLSCCNPKFVRDLLMTNLSRSLYFTPQRKQALPFPPQKNIKNMFEFPNHVCFSSILLA